MIRETYHEAFEKADEDQKRKILRRYFAHFPDLAFEPASWSGRIWLVARQNKDKKFLALVARAVTSPKPQSRHDNTHWIDVAKYWLEDLKNDDEIKDIYADYKECRSVETLPEAVRREHIDCYLGRLIQHLQESFPTRRHPDTGEITFGLNNEQWLLVQRKIQAKGLAEGLAFLVAEICSVRRRDLYSTQSPRP